MNLAKFKTRLILLWLGAAGVFSCPVLSEGLDILQSPLATKNLAPPVVMFALSRDQQLHGKAYTDTNDLNNDGKIDFTYDDSIDYLGYFDSYKCYDYVKERGRFEPTPLVGTPDLTGHQCSGGIYWSGNFLNWATMTRMDIMRRILYGGYRSTDEPNTYDILDYPNFQHIDAYVNQDKTTVLERDMIPFDGHAFVKVFSSEDMDKYTPYSVDAISICNLTQGVGLSKDLSTLEYPPLMRVASGTWPEWASDAGIQCQWASTTGPGTNLNLVDDETEKSLNVRVQVCVSGQLEQNCLPYVDPDNPIASYKTTYKPTGLQQKYNNLNSPLVMGVYSGSWGKNQKGGVFRALSDPYNLSVTNIYFENYNPAIGVVLPMDASIPIGSVPLSLDRFRITGYDFSLHRYVNALDWGNPVTEIYSEVLRYLTFQTFKDNHAYLVDDTENVPTRIPPNPIYYSFNGFNYIWPDSVLSVDAVTGDIIGPPAADPSTDTYESNEWLNNHYYALGISWCSVTTAIIMSSGTNSFDTDDIANDLVESNQWLVEPPTELDIAAETNSVSEAEGINGKYLVGSNGSDIDGQCTPKSLSSLSSAKGICPDGPNLKGGYQMAGMAHYVRKTDLHKNEVDRYNSDYGYTERYWVGDQTISTYSVLLSEAARFNVAVNGAIVTLMPSCMANSVGTADQATSDWTPCSILDVRVESLNYVDGPNGTKDLISGSFTVTWEDATEKDVKDEGTPELVDYDMDGIERVAFSVSGETLNVTTSVLKTDTHKAMRFGYLLAGSASTTGSAITDGTHYPLLCPGDINCVATESTPSPYTKGTAATSAKLLESPLWYAAKYGGLLTLDATKPLTPQGQGQASWDANADGVPDKFYKATNPLLLEDALDKSFTTLASTLTSSASAAANSTRLDTSAALYQAKYLPSTWAGQLLAFAIDTSTGVLAETPTWDAGAKLAVRDFGDRSIYSYNEDSKQGIEFDNEQLSDANKALFSSTQELIDIINFIKGDHSNEISIQHPTGFLRERLGAYKLGDIVNSDPQFVSNSSRGYDRLPGNEGKDYLKYFTSPEYKARPPMLAVGANDGMLHVFNASLDATGGNELFAYVPTTIVRNLKSLSSPVYSAFQNHHYYVDGSPLISDAYIDADGNHDKEWRTVLVGGLGAGGKGVFALDITLLSTTDYKTAVPFSQDRVLWEINDNLAFNEDDRLEFHENLGLTMGQPSIARMANGQFAAVFGNGYNSRSQQAVLYIVDLATGQLISAINTGVGGSTDATTFNGLSAPLTVDANGDHIVDAIYAGDYQGNMWKFDVSSADPANWRIGTTSNGQEDGAPVPLFTAIAQAYDFTVPGENTLLQGTWPPVTMDGKLSIVAKPVFMQHPQGGVMLYFGTGKYMMLDDALQNVQSYTPEGDYINEFQAVNGFFGLWDGCMNYAGSTGSPCFSTAITKENLVKQTIVGENPALFQRATSKNAVAYPSKKGWYIELVYCDVSRTDGCVQMQSAERVVSEALILNNKIIFSTLYLNLSYCDTAGGSWLMSVDALTGKAPDTSSFLTSVGGTYVPMTITVDGHELAVSGVRSRVGITDTPSVVKTDGGKIKVVTSGSKGDTEEHTMLDSHGNRHSWVQIR